MQANWVDFFRFNNGYEDVFIEDDHYLYASAEPFGWAYLMACVPYKLISGKGFIRGDPVGRDAAYLNSLEWVDYTTASAIVGIEESYSVEVWEKGPTWESGS